MRLRVRDMTEIFGINPNTVRAHIQRGYLPAHRVGPRVFYIDPEDAANSLGMPVERVRETVEAQK